MSILNTSHTFSKKFYQHSFKIELKIVITRLYSQEEIHREEINH